MFQLTPLEPVDYLVIGHLTRDLTNQGPRLGGTAAYSALTAQALGMRAGIVTTWAAGSAFRTAANDPDRQLPVRYQLNF